MKSAEISGLAIGDMLFGTVLCAVAAGVFVWLLIFKVLPFLRLLAVGD